MESIETKSSVLQIQQVKVDHEFPLKKNFDSHQRHNLLLFLLTGILIVTITLYYYFIPAAYFRSPLDVSTAVAGTFGEVREGHFHLGLDIRTGGKENLPVYAMADGYVYRVSIQPDGYGKALFIAYRNGMMSVYGHLKAFMPEVEAALLDQQQLSEQWEQEMFFSANRFPVKKGAIVAYSGNTGFSQGPHLHVEIRNSKNKMIINPAIAGIPMRDRYSPVIKNIFVYDGTKSFYQVKGRQIGSANGKEQSYDNITEVWDSIVRIGMEAYDRNDHPKFKLGIYQAQLFLDDRLQFEFRMDSIPIAKERYVNATIDYAQWIHHKRTIQLLFVLPGNQLTTYQRCGNGSIVLSDGRLHRVKLIVKDAAGNSKSEEFVIRYKSRIKSISNATSKLLHPGTAHKVTSRNAVVYFSPLALYDAVPFVLKESDVKSAGVVSPNLTVHDPAVPVHTRYRVQLKTYLPANDPHRKKVLLELTSGQEKQYVKGEWRGDHMDGTFDRFGKIRLIMDERPPVVSKTNWDAKGFSSGDVLKLTVRDNSGRAESFTARIDGRWVPFEQKRDLFYYEINQDLSKGKHQLVVTVTDKVGNKRIENFDFMIK